MQSDIDAETVFLKSALKRSFKCPIGFHQMFSSQDYSSFSRVHSSCLECFQAVSGFLKLSRVFLNVFKLFRVSLGFSMYCSTQVTPERTCAVLSSAQVAPERTCAVFSSAQVAPEDACAVFSNAQVASERTCAVFSSAQVAPERTCAVISNAQVAPEHTCAVF